MEKTEKNCLIFFAPTNEETIQRIRFCIKQKLPFFPVSTRELSLPKVDLPPSGILLATSGSSGAPKQAHLSLDNLFTNASFCHPALALGPTDSYLLSVPLYHVSGLSILIRSMHSGAKVILPNSGKDREVTHVSFVPTQLKRFLQKPSLYPKLKAILLGGAPIPYDLCKKTYDLGIPLYITYGMTEMASQIATEKFDPKKGISFGAPLPQRKLKIVDGEIYVQGETLFQGYHNLPSPFIDGWLPTKDLGCFGPNGLELIGRKDRMFISGGENIHPEEIEKALLSHPKISQAKIIPRPDLEFGQRPTAYVTTTLDTLQIRSHLSALLPRFKIPSIKDIFINSNNFYFGK